jgi:xanthine dehydrogenase small subunit
MAATPKRALAVERQLIGADVNDSAAWRSAAEQVSNDFTPLTDMRASAEYRLDVARNLVIKALAEISGAASPVTRILGRQEALHVAP